MSELYVPLAIFLRPVPPPASNEPPSPPARQEEPVSARSREHDEALRGVRRFRAGLADALENAVNGLLPMIAHDVLARELQLSPADVGAIAAAALDRFSVQDVLCVRLHPSDCDALSGFECKLIPDDSFEPGDIRIELHCGTIDVSLNARLDAALNALQ
jgi:flagellar biosynthesis/type III secretory pathway protein FliH